MPTKRKTKKKPVPQYAQFSLAEGYVNKVHIHTELLPLWVYNHFDYFVDHYHQRVSDAE